MVQFRDNSYALTLIKYICFSGELPWTSLSLIPGEHRIIVRYIKKMKDEEYITVNGKGQQKTIRLTTKGISVLQEKLPDIYPDYMFNSCNHHFSGGASGIVSQNRRFRLSEAVSIISLADSKIWSYEKPALFLNQSYDKITDISQPLFYYSREIKNVDGAQRHKTEFTRILGMIVSEGGVYNIYNTNKSLIKWNNQGENKAQILVSDIINSNFNIDPGKTVTFKSENCIIFGKGMEPVIDILNNTKHRLPDENGFELLSFKNTYENIHYLPIDFNGAAMLKLLLDKNYMSKLTSKVFSEPNEKTNTSAVSCDYISNGQYYLLFFDGNISKLRKFYMAASLYQSDAFHILCFPFQYSIIKEYVGDLIPIQTIPLSEII